MLPKRLLAFDVRDGAILPRFLGSGDQPWLARLLEEVPALAGRTVGEWERAAETEWVPRALADGASQRAALGVVELLRRSWRSTVDAPLAPAKARRVVFEHAAREHDRDRALALAAGALGVEGVVLERVLFADRASRRVLVSPESWPSAHELGCYYNLVLAQSLLMRAHRMTVRVRAQVHSVVRFAKLKRLICTCAPEGDGTTLLLSGPLSVLRHTTKYGHALASFVPAVLATPGWSIDATCMLADHLTGALTLRAGDPLASTHALPRAYDSALEKRLAADVRALRAGWEIQRESTALPLVLEDGTQRLFYPDFALTRGAQRVLVEIVGFYTPQYLAHKIALLRAATTHRIVFCVDDALGISDQIDSPALVRFHKRIDARALLAAVTRVAEGCMGASPM